jgi:hypothetical protein
MGPWVAAQAGDGSVNEAALRAVILDCFGIGELRQRLSNGVRKNEKALGQRHRKAVTTAKFGQENSGAS